LKGIKEGNDEGGRKSLAASEAQSDSAGKRRRGGFLTGIGRCGGEDGTDTRDPGVSGGLREGAEMEGVNQRRKRTSAITPMARAG
jgi:hypothetical protein